MDLDVLMAKKAETWAKLIENKKKINPVGVSHEDADRPTS